MSACQCVIVIPVAIWPTASYGVWISATDQRRQIPDAISALGGRFEDRLRHISVLGRRTEQQLTDNGRAALQAWA